MTLPAWCGGQALAIDRPDRANVLSATAPFTPDRRISRPAQPERGRARAGRHRPAGDRAEIVQCDLIGFPGQHEVTALQLAGHGDLMIVDVLAVRAAPRDVERAVPGLHRSEGRADPGVGDDDVRLL